MCFKPSVANSEHVDTHIVIKYFCTYAVQNVYLIVSLYVGFMYIYIYIYIYIYTGYFVERIEQA